PVRVLARDRATVIDGELFRSRIERAVQRRRAFGLPSPETNALRLVNAEGDDLPGLIVDVFADVAVMQLGPIGMKRRETMLLEAIERVLEPRAIVDRTSSAVARGENFQLGEGVVRGETDLSSLSFSERGLSYELPLSLAQKTGFYLDQR